MAYAVEPISPELALVSPELASSARVELPDRPWEAFLPSIRLPAIPLAEVKPAPARAVQPVAMERRRRRFRPPIGLMLLLAFAGVVVAGSVLPVRDAPTLGPPSAPAIVPSPRVPSQTEPTAPRRTTEPPKRPLTLTF
jgi:hypothetical protein